MLRDEVKFMLTDLLAYHAGSGRSVNRREFTARARAYSPVLARVVRAQLDNLSSEDVKHLYDGMVTGK